MVPHPPTIALMSPNLTEIEWPLALLLIHCGSGIAASFFTVQTGPRAFSYFIFRSLKSKYQKRMVLL